MRAKFWAESITYYGSANTLVNLVSVVGGTEENKAFWQDTPNGKLEMFITNPTAREFFAAGAEYYIDFIPVTGDSG